jgi:hypothetical protein
VNIVELLPVDGGEWRNKEEMQQLLQCDEDDWKKLLALGLLKEGKATKKFGTRYQMLREKMAETLLGAEAMHRALPALSAAGQGYLEGFYLGVVGSDSAGVVLRLLDRTWLGGAHWTAVLAVGQQVAAALRCGGEDLLHLASLGALDWAVLRAGFETLRDGGEVEGGGGGGVDWTRALLVEKLRSFEYMQEELSFNRHELEELLEEEHVASFLIDGKYFILDSDSRRLLEEVLEDI